jgi:gentisate 1,2-dioxygenase
LKDLLKNLGIINLNEISQKESWKMNRQMTANLERGQEKQPRKGELVFASAYGADYKEIVPGLSKAALWGNSDIGPYGAFTKMVPGFDAGTHTHTNDVWIVVLQGAYLYRDAAGERRVEPGDFFRIRGGMKHWSGADTKEGALFYEELSGKFDLVRED